MRIVSLCPSLTELVFALDRGIDLVGITDYCVHPASGVAGIERVGGTKDPVVPRIIELAPDLVLLNDEENRLEDATALGDAGVRCLSSLPRSPHETAAMVRSIGTALDRIPGAEQIAEEIEIRAESVARASHNKTPIPFAYLIWRKPWMTVNGDTFAHSLLALAGGVNAFGARPERYPAVTADEIREVAPAVLLLGSEPFPFDESHVPELSAATGIDARRIRLVDGEYLSWYGSRTPAGIDYAEQIIRSVRESSGG